MLFITENNWKQYESELGGKALHLFRLRQNNFRVPALFSLSTKAFQAHCSSISHFPELVLALDFSTPARLAETAGRLRNAIIEQPLTESFQRELSEQFERQFPSRLYVAVRSSAVGEDSAQLSFAGQMDSFLFCLTVSDVETAIRKCWASVFSDRALTYRKMQGIQAQPKIGVVIQEMIEGQVSGVAFTANPLTQKRSELLITSTFGLGEGIVSGALNTDQFVLSRKSRELRSSEIAEKTQRIVFDTHAKRGTREEDCPLELRKTASLTGAQLELIAEECLKIERAFGLPQDVEWTLRNGELFILQARPITTLDAMESEARAIEDEAYETIWDNSNIVESYSGVTTPLTYSFANHCYYMVYVQFCEILKVPREKIEQFDFNFRNMLGLIRGRIYYNLKNWYRLISVLPGYEYNKGFMEQMMGIKDAHRLAPGEALIETISNRRKYFVELPRLIWVGINLSYQFLSLDRNVKKFISIYQTVYNQYKDADFSRLSLHEIVSAYNDMERRVLRNWKPPIINDFMAMIFYGVLKKLILKWNLDKNGSLQNQLLGGQGDVESTLPIKRLESIAAFIRGESDLLEDFKAMDRASLKLKYLGEGAHPELHRRLQAYLEEFGYRCMNELKLEEPSLKDQPEFLFSILKNYAGCPATESSNESADEAAAALEEVRMTLVKDSVLGLSPKWWVFKFVLDFAKKAVKVREYQRFARTKMFGLMRNLFRVAGQKLSELGALENSRDVFYLTKDEIFGFVSGASVTLDLKALVCLRKSEFQTYLAEEEPADRVETRGAVYLSKDRSAEKSQEVPFDGAASTLQGTSCCPGKVRGRVKVILKPSDDMSLSGEILVAGRTDPGWVTLYPSASGLLIERGSVLSHSAIVARELRLPAIVGIPHITKLLKTGDLVEMDGSTGIIRKLPSLELQQDSLRSEITANP